MLSTGYSCQILTNLNRFSKNTQLSNFIKFHHSGSRIVPCGQTDRHDEANSRFSQVFRMSLKTDASVKEVRIRD